LAALATVESLAKVARMITSLPVAATARCAVLFALLSVALVGCAADDPAGAPSSVGARTGTIVPNTGRMRPPVATPVTPPVSVVKAGPPTISGKPLTAVNAGAHYQFVPTASGPHGAVLTFAVQNKPEWATFDNASGMLAGTPTAANVGTYTNIVVSVSDGEHSVSLAPFAVSVNQMSAGAAVLDWTAPTENTDGSALTDLAGYKVYYGTSASNLTESVKVANPGLTNYTIGNLTPGKWYFAVTSITTAGVESAPSGVVTASL
jgi:hypothetical protein